MSSFSGGPQSALPPVSSHVLDFPGLEEESKGRDKEAPAAGLQPQHVPQALPQPPWQRSLLSGQLVSSWGLWWQTTANNGLRQYTFIIS